MSCVVSAYVLVHLTVCYCDVMHKFQNKSTTYSFPDVKGLLAWNRCCIWSLSDANRIWTHNHLVCSCRQALNHLVKLPKWLSCVHSSITAQFPLFTMLPEKRTIACAGTHISKFTSAICRTYKIIIFSLWLYVSRKEKGPKVVHILHGKTFCLNC